VYVSSQGDPSEDGCVAYAFVITRDITTGPLTVSFSLGGTATEGADYPAAGTSVTFEDGVGSAHVGIIAMWDNVVEPGNESVILSITNIGTTYTSMMSTASMTIWDDPARISASTANTTEGSATPGYVRFSRSGGNPTEALALSFSIGGTATNGLDYTTISGSATIAASATSVDVNVASLADNIVEAFNETVTMTIMPSGTYLLAGNATSIMAVVTISEPPIPPPPSTKVWLSAETTTHAESHLADIYVIRADGDLSQPLTASLAIGIPPGGNPAPTWNTDYTLTLSGGGSASLGSLGGTVTFAAGQTEILLVLAALGDAVVEDPETFIFSVEPDAAPADYLPGSDGAGWAAMLDLTLVENSLTVYDDARSTHNTPVSGIVTSFDPEGDAISFAVTTAPAKGTVDLSANGEYTYTPNPGANGIDTFVLTGSDGHGATDPGLVTITLTNVAPVANPASATTWAGQSKAIAWSGWDYESDPLSVSAWTAPVRIAGDLLSNGYGTVAYDAITRQFTYAPPDSTWVGTVAFEFTLDDAHGGFATGTITIVVIPTAAAVAVNDNYQMSEDGTLTLAASEGVLINDTIPTGAVAVLHSPMNPALGTVAVNGDGGFTAVLSAAANAAIDPVEFKYDVRNPLGALLAQGTVVLIPSLANFNWFRAKEVSFDTFGRPIVADDQVRTYDTKQWLDANANGVQDKGDQSDPVHFVRGKSDTIKVNTVVLVPALATNMDAAKYKLEGTFHLSGASTGIVLLSAGTGVKNPADGSWTFKNMTTNSVFSIVASFLPISIQWKLLRQDAQPLNKMLAGTTQNPLYITYDHIGAGAPNAQKFPLLRTFVHLGSVGLAAGVNLDTREKVIDHIWTKFSDAKIKTWDGRDLVYYKDWTLRNDSKADEKWTTSHGLVKGGEGECTSFAKLMIDAMRAQGLEQPNDMFGVKSAATTKSIAPRIEFRELMFIGKWKTTVAGHAILPGEEFKNYQWINGTQEFDPGRRLGWSKDANGVWDYRWAAALSEVVKDNTDTLSGQNNTKPAGIFTMHFLVKLQISGVDVFFDPSYGKKYNSIKEWENASVGFYAYGIAPFAWPTQATQYKLGFMLRANPTAAIDPSDVVQDTQITDH